MYGMLGTKERVYLIEGKLNIESAPGKDTKTHITIPKSKTAFEN